MKQRIISALFGLVLLAVVIFFYDSVLFNIAIFLISLLATYELLNATKLFQYREFAVLGVGFSLCFSFAQQQEASLYLPLGIFALLVYFFIFVIRKYKELRFEKMAMGLYFVTVVPLFFSTPIYLREEFGPVAGLYFLLLALGSAWFCDTGAYFSGYFFGKTKMAPTISPKKTVEGGVGGVLVTVLCNLAVAYFYSRYYHGTSPNFQVNLVVVGVVSPILALLGMLGDLVASVIKRQYEVKDYGHIMPGHGGVMDRFDSVFLTFPAVYVVAKVLPILL